MHLFLLAQTEPEEPGWFTQAILDFFMWLINWLCTLIKPWIVWAMEVIPDSYVTRFDDTVGSLVIYISPMNSWIAMDWMFTLLGAWIAFIVVFLVVKLSIKLFIPTVG